MIACSRDLASMSPMPTLGIMAFGFSSGGGNFVDKAVNYNPCPSQPLIGELINDNRDGRGHPLEVRVFPRQGVLIIARGRSGAAGSLTVTSSALARRIT
tara:strand:+ start:882 stop:1178 length:297 start_codon:yes stop_codon:yes gene_type:complete